jgi:colanic acid biosynthesis glycosyl transferase WcaI
MRILLLNQCFYPDVVSTAQHLTDLALGLAGRGHKVTVLASQRGYDDPTHRFRARETWRGIEIIRIPTLGLGKGAKWRRCLNFASYLIFCFVRLMFLPRQDLTVALTSPPLISFLGALFVKLRGGRLCLWIMDLNPDEAVALGWLREDSVITRILQELLKYSLKRSDKIIALDRFMQERIVSKGVPAECVTVVLPWPHDDDIRYDEAGRTAFRAAHGLTEKFVVMYSGNHSACHPLDTLLAAAGRLEADDKIFFCFVGGGSEFQKVKDFARDNSLANVLCLGYQPRNGLSASLSAADLHLVVMGDPFTGLVHPCKVYNIVAIGAPFLYIGPEESHVSDLLKRHANGINARSARHGEVEEVVAHIRAAAAAGPLRIKDAEQVTSHFSYHTLLPRMISTLEDVAENATALPVPSAAQSQSRR